MFGKMAAAIFETAKLLRERNFADAPAYFQRQQLTLTQRRSAIYILPTAKDNHSELTRARVLLTQSIFKLDILCIVHAYPSLALLAFSGLLRFH
uniref:Coatomer alpha subunit C-terminal domain-containing protein n=1 Tax=Trichuris muris TaxID=70415 RepID=A0A5S6QS06_TRIMR